MKPEDFAALHAKAFRATRAWSATEFANLLGQRGVNWYGDPRCFILIRQVADEAEILTLATDPDHCRQGLARAALSRAETAATDAGVHRFFLEVAEDNAAARALYATFGYTQVGRRPDYYLPKDGAPVAALVLQKERGAS
ncbi:GNAT family N-acetyltransferase [Cognatiyoonia sp. IB215446]|uniref:GNAT family N-acetyltransferase n=1 Tax=Cognatiyoonia sp. IB215446 TaxID=3097355 RepID=UPI002A138A31|nr:GNAT family N-acetyltransferase [Cognatiyoonia sp. IB215446]MDX8347036.1 GNAT family N-acetyltransferase [Cognatiyoonia sp. IB215446]